MVIFPSFGKEHTASHATMWYFSPAPLFHRAFPPLINFSIPLATEEGMIKRDQKELGTLERVVSTRTSCPPFGKLFQDSGWVGGWVSVWVIERERERDDIVRCYCVLG